MHQLIRLIYALLIAGAVVAFVILGIYSVYQPPKYPDYPTYSYSADQTAYDDQQQADYNKAVDAYNKQEKHFNHNAALIALPVSVVITVAGVYLLKRSEVIGEGIGLGGAGTAIYATVVSSEADARILRFLAVAVLLASLVLVAQKRFSKEQKAS